MTKKQNISLGKTGMDSDTHPSGLSETQYTYAKNLNLENESGNTLNATPEKSNILATRFKQGFKVIHSINDIDTTNTYFFLVNPITGVGEFGVVENNQNINDLQDLTVNCNNCTNIKELAEPLENINQASLQTYTTLISDECHVLNNEPEKGFMFNILNPIKKSVIKNEKCGKILYFSHKGNSPRYINISNIQDYFIQEVPCNDDIILTCPNFDKMRVFKLFEIPDLEPSAIELGGNLKMGTYEFLIAYCNLNGQEISEYYSITAPIKLFDENNKIQEEKNKADRINFAIKLNIKNIDKKYPYFKIVVIQNADLENTDEFFEVGVFSSDTTSVLYSSELNKKKTSFDVITTKHLFVEEAEGVATANNILYQYGITNKKELNLQPVINLLGEIGVKWQTHIANEDLYTNPISISKYLGYNREEIVPLGIKFLLSDGFETSIFPLINRLPTIEDLEEVPITNTDRKSVENINSCIGLTRDKRWKLYDTSTVDDDFCSGDIETKEVTELVTRYCKIEKVAEIPQGEAIISLDNNYTNLEDYINDNIGENQSECSLAYETPTVDICSYLYADYSSITCPPIKIQIDLLTLTPTTGNIDLLIGSSNYSIIFDTDVQTTVLNFVSTNSASILTNTGATITASPTTINFYNTSPNINILSNSGDIICSIVKLFEDNCSDIEIVKSSVNVAEIKGEQKTDIEKIFPIEYTKMSPLKVACNPFIIATSEFSQTYGSRVELDTDPPLGWGCTIPILGRKYPIVAFKRDSDFINQDCTYSYEIINNQNTSSNIAESVFFNYKYSENVLNLLQSKISTPYTVGSLQFYNNLSTTALFFNGNTEGKTRFILDVAKQKISTYGGDSISTSSYLRLSLYKKCSDTASIYSSLIDINNGGIYLFEKIGSNLKITDGSGVSTTIVNGWFSNKNFIISLDCPISYNTGIIGISPSATLDDCDDMSPVPNRFIINTIAGCTTISKRDIEYGKALLKWDSIRLDKEIEYTALCTFNQPIIKNCDAVPYKKGNFSYWESSLKYPDNNSLYNSSNLVIKPTDLPSYIRNRFRDSFSSSITNGQYIWKKDNDDKELVDFTCRNIRHFKFPSNKISPFMWDSRKKPFSSTPIFPLGITINEEIIVALLDIALKNNLISREDRNKIKGYEVVRGDLKLDRSVVASGLLYDMRTYTDIDNKEKLYPNYPYNSFSNDKLNNLPKQSNFGVSGSKFTFHSPETEYYSTLIPNEFSVQGYMFGNSKGHFDEVKNHPKYVILTEKARSLASQLSILELVAEAVIQAATAASNAQVWTVVGFTNGLSLGIPAFTASAVIGAFSAITAAVFKYGRYRYQWLQTFQNLGTPHNFAYYYYSEGYYNYLDLLQEEKNQLRGLPFKTYLKDGSTIKTDEFSGEVLNINNNFREASVMLSTGEYPIIYNSTYTNYDNNNYTSSLPYSSESGVREAGRSKEVIKNIASIYGYLKNYKEDQHGEINSIKWLSTGFRNRLENPTSNCLPIFGGDTYICKHSLKRKHSQFLVNSMGQADRTPFNYFFYNNIGNNPKFYLSYGINKNFEGGGKLFPELDDDFVFDLASKDGNYYTEPSRFYLFYYGIPKFLCESRINTNFRYGGIKYEERSPETAGDIGDWTQESNVSIREKNWYFYNKIYSKDIFPFKNRTLPSNYDKNFNNCKTDFPNGIISSLPDNSENNDYDPWLIYRPLDFFEFPTSFGNLIDVQGIENEAIITRFKNTSILWNKVDYTNDDGQNPTKPFLGGTSIFQRRSTSFYNAQLGFGGTQNTTSISCEYGHFHVDSIRGQVIQTQPSGNKMEEISSIINGKPSGKRNWFKEHLPFKIKKYFKDVDVDNHYNGVGICMGWDSRYRRVFITKKDYIPKNLNIIHNNGKYFLEDEEISLLNDNYFQDVSWTIAYSPIYGSWISYYDFHPNYYVNHNNYFQTGINSEDDKNGLWSHLLTNKSYFVFYGHKYSYEIEIPIKSDLVTKNLESITLWTEALRYQNEYDFFVSNELTFDKSLIWNNIACSGYLNLIPQKNNFKSVNKYPITNSNNTQDILISNKDNFKWSYNYFFDRVSKKTINTYFIENDKNQIDKKLNANAISFKGDKVLRRLNGDWFLNRLSYSKDSRFKLLFKFMTSISEV